MFERHVARLLMVVPALCLHFASSEAQKHLDKAWWGNNYPKVRTYTNHTGSGPNYAADFYFTERNHADLYLNSEIPLADGLPGIPVLNAHSGYAYLLLYDLTVLGGGNFPWIDAERVIAGLDSIPRHSFSFDDMNEMRRRIDMEFVVDSLSWRSLYVHLQIDDQYFNLSGVEQAIRQAIADLYNNVAPTCGSTYQRVAIDLQTQLTRETLLGTSNNWGIAADEHLHFQVFEGEYFPSCLGAPLNLADANEVTMADQIILDSALVVGVPGCEGGTCFYYPAMVRQEFLPNDNVMIDAAWDGGSAANLRETPGGSIITALPNGTQGTLLTGPAVAALPDETYHVWWQCEFAAGTGWVAAEYLEHLIPNDFIPTEVVAWGRNIYGQCDAPPDSDFVAVAAGHGHSLGLKANGSIKAWGLNDNGQLDVPPPNTEFGAIAGGSGYSMGLKAYGSIVAWGSNVEGECEIPSPNSDFAAIAGGGAHGLGLKTDGSIVTWGNNDYGQGNVPPPNTDFVAVAGGNIHSLGLKANGSIVAWGSNAYGQCDVPPPNTNFVAVAAGMGEHSLGLKSDGSVVAWGWNADGQCDVPLPNTGFIAIAAGQYHSLALKIDGSIVVWGANWNNFGQRNVPPPNDDFVTIAAGANHSLGVRLLSPPTGISDSNDAKLQRILLVIEPNPTSNVIRARFSLLDPSQVQINLYDISGRLLAHTALGEMSAGAHSFAFPNQQLANGMYFCTINADAKSATKSFVVLK